MSETPQEQSPRQPGETDEQYGARLREEAKPDEGTEQESGSDDSDG